jgi:hypothetical protein
MQRIFRLLLNFGKTGNEPWYGKNTCGMERFAPRPDNVELTGGDFLAGVVNLFISMPA